MIKIRIEIWPGGDESRAQTLGVINIANISNLAEVSDYACQAADQHGKSVKFDILNHRRSAGWLKLVTLAVNKVFSTQKKHGVGLL